MNTVLMVDGHNFTYRSRSGFQLGDYNVVFNFFRSFKPLIDKFEPTRVIFTLEGHPKKRYDVLPSYKANRHVTRREDATLEEAIALEKKLKSDEDYRRQHNIIVDLLSKYFPVSVMRHPDFEADDLIYNVINNASSVAEFVIVSTDTDFIQAIQKFPNAQLYNPVSKKFVNAPDYDYLTWKALRGDGSDNVPGLKGVGDKKAEELLNDPERMKALFEDKDVADQFAKNVELIRLATWSVEEHADVESSSPKRDWGAVEAAFKEFEFKSMLKEPYLSNFKATFDRLWGEDAR